MLGSYYWPRAGWFSRLRYWLTGCSLPVWQGAVSWESYLKRVVFENAHSSCFTEDAQEAGCGRTVVAMAARA